MTAGEAPRPRVAVPHRRDGAGCLPPVPQEERPPARQPGRPRIPALGPSVTGGRSSNLAARPGPCPGPGLITGSADSCRPWLPVTLLTAQPAAELSRNLAEQPEGVPGERPPGPPVFSRCQLTHPSPVLGGSHLHPCYPSKRTQHGNHHLWVTTRRNSATPSRCFINYLGCCATQGYVLPLSGLLLAL